MAGLEEEQIQRAVLENTIFGQGTPEQSGPLVRALREQGKVVAMIDTGLGPHR